MDNIVELLKRKYGPAPLWVYLSIGVLGLAWYLRYRASKAAPKAKDDETLSAADGVLDQFALAYPMPTQGGEIISAPLLPSQQPHEAQPTPVSSDPKYADVLPGWHVNQWIMDYRKIAGGEPNLDWTRLETLNPGIAQNVSWHKDSQANYFKSGARYRVA